MITGRQLGPRLQPSLREPVRGIMRPYAVPPGSSSSGRVVVRSSVAPSLPVWVYLLTLALFSSTAVFAQDSDRQYQPAPQPNQQYGYQQPDYPQQDYPPSGAYGDNSQQQPYAEPPYGNDAAPGAQPSEAPPQSYAQDSGDAQSLSEAQLEQLVAPIALYPDMLVAQVLAASTYPQQVAAADRWRHSQGYAPPDQIVADENAQNWDPSVKALAAFPQVLAQMDRNLQWTIDLGNAYYNQPQDVLHAVQVMRRRAQDAGSLRNSPQEAVEYQQGNIVLAPPNPQVVYVPEYNPWAVYGAPVAPYPGFSVLAAAGSFLGNVGVRFGWGIATAAFAHSPFGLLAWGLDWLAHAVLFHGSTYDSHSMTVRDWGLPHGGPRAFSRGATFAARSNSPYRRGDGFERGNSGFRNFRAPGSYRTPTFNEGNRDLYARSRPEDYRSWQGSRDNYAHSSERGFRSFRTVPNQPLRDARSNYTAGLSSRDSYNRGFYGQERNGRQNSEFRSNGYAQGMQASRASHSSLERNFKHSKSFKADSFSRSFAKNNRSAEHFGRPREPKQSRHEKSFASAKGFGKSHFSEHGHSGGHGGKHHG
jgi:hypothetical protein